jgi:hypothetical protein
MAEHLAASDRGVLATGRSPQFHAGQTVWLNGRRATFVYYASAQAAAIRYQEERSTRIVPINRLAATPPARS